MIRSRTGTVRLKLYENNETKKTFEISITNYKCLFCNKNILISNIHDAKCSCGSQWFEKKKSKQYKICKAV